MVRFLPVIDLHCHMLPGVDDGPRDLPGSLALAGKLEEIGFTHVCATPHLPWMNRVIGADELRRIREEVSACLQENGVAADRQDIRGAPTPVPPLRESDEDRRVHNRSRIPV